MRRAHFVAGAFAAVTLIGKRAIADPQFDPASPSDVQSLRVLLGRGSAQPLDAGTFLYEGRRYRGTFSRTADGSIVSVVPLEAYLYSVVPREMPRSWPAQALQAQAIAARTYVLQRSNPQRDYDVVPSEADQVYTGIDAESLETSGAVDATAGQVLRYDNEFAQIVYSSCCGGHTEASSDAWNGPPIAYLRGVACAYCTDSPWYRWTKSVPLSTMRERFGDRFDAIGTPQRIGVDQVDASGRARTIRIDGDTGSLQIKAADFRRALGSRTVPSLLLHRIALDGTLTLEGGGLGHGVGLCQWGARGAAQTGMTARGILAVYFPGTAIGRD
ncbi:MAG: SpoIID/LytB domain-containing protein [Candidatus Eremiobacteraeota bacterium]|nr:SpoIID/LytB domain-containing protein [Candidatus Eremiobacteraeota bacterium]